MHYLYLDESGDLGDPQTPGASRHLVIIVLDVEGTAARKLIEKGVERTLKNKVRRRESRIAELKGSGTTLAEKQYFFRHMAPVPFQLYTVILDKKHYRDQLLYNQNRVYTFLTHLVLKEIPLEQASTQVVLTLDRRRGSFANHEFNTSLRTLLEARISPRVLLDINHYLSHESKPLQAVDLFAWGIRRKYEQGDLQWYGVFQEKIRHEQMHPVK
ncbi:DUF3800 domain-containing protein [candidate division KSB1 bacterium]|nr:DUF3800 domain-containing protein [candidate division KSB1 bacterium]